MGYGLISPGLRDEKGGVTCLGINILMALESFVGVLFGGMTGAVIFAKIARIQSFAHVAFSDPIVVRYGSGCIHRAKDHLDAAAADDSENVEEDDLSELPCPILEFRLVNTMWNQKGGEIMDAGVNLVVARLETMHEVDERMAKMKRKRKRKKTVRRKISYKQKKAISLFNVTDGRKTPRKGSFFQRVNDSAIASAIAAANADMPTTVDELEEAEEEQPYNRAAREEQERKEEEQEWEEEEEHERKEEEQEEPRLWRVVKAVQKQMSNRKSIVADVDISMAVDEGEGVENHRMAPRRIFSPLEVITDGHPFFRRTWNIRHVCNEHSPLLSSHIRAMIADNHGFWPRELNSYGAVREAINFHEIIVSFSGTANASGSSLYTQKVYSYVDMTIGYAFVNVLAKNNEGKLIVDASRLNDVKVQRGGSCAEPIRNKDAPNFAGYSNTTRAAGLQNHDEDDHDVDEKKETDDNV